MFEVKKEGSTNKSLWLPISLIEKLENLAKENDTSFNRVVIQCCEYALENMKEEMSS